ncbi:MAG TPA: acyl carrier protein [Terriglobales bacterium]|jgi:acyl carrier protein|nr:acyl carrier protein [Terriglobales bacterium]
MLSSEDKLKQVFADVFGVDSNSIDENSSVDTIEKWNSFNHMKLVLALEEQYDVRFQMNQTIEMLSYALVKVVLSEHGIVFN